MSREIFEKEILSNLNTKFSSREYAVKRYEKGHKKGQYVKYETNLAWTWWNKSLEKSKCTII